MSNENQKPANDKLHPSDLGETKDFNDLSFDKEKQSYEFDVKGEDKNYDHPMPYETGPTGAVNDDSTFDEANPFVEDEYATEVDKVQDKLNELWEQDSNIEKSDFAWMEKEKFKVLVSLLDVKELELLEKYKLTYSDWDDFLKKYE